MSAYVTFVESLVLWQQFCDWHEQKGPNLHLGSVTECSWTCLGAACTLLHSRHAKTVFASCGAPMQDARMVWSLARVPEPCCLTQDRPPPPLVLVRNAVSRVSRAHLQAVHFPGASQRNEGWLFLLWLICATSCPDVSAKLDFYLAAALKSNQMELGFVLATWSSWVDLLLCLAHWSVIDKFLLWVFGTAHWSDVKKSNFLELFPGSGFTGLVNLLSSLTH